MQRRLDLSVGDGHQSISHVVIWQLSCAVAGVGDMQVQHPPLRVQSGGHGTSHTQSHRRSCMRDAISDWWGYGGGKTWNYQASYGDSSLAHDAE